MYKFILFIFISIVVWAETPIFVLHSYHEDYPWTKKQNIGFKSVLDNVQGINPLYSTEHLDTKRRAYDEEYEEEFVHYLRSKYKGYSPKLIYVSDDNALDFMIHYAKTFFPNVPIVFSGINDLSLQNKLDQKIFTGVFENKDIISNIKLIMTLFPGETEILLIGDNSTTCKAMQRDIDDEIQHIPNLKTKNFHSQDIESIIRDIKEFKGKVAILKTIGSFRTKEGKRVPLKEAIKRIVNAGDLKIISLEDTYVQEGVLGGRVNDGMSQGSYAGEMALEILTTPESALPKINTNVNSWIFDAKALEKHAIVLPEKIAKESKILNGPKTFFDVYKKYIIASLYALITIIFLGSLFFTRYIYRSRRTIIKKEERLSIVTESMNHAQEIAHLGNWDWDIKTNCLWWSDEIYRIFGLQPQECESTIEAFLHYVHPEDREMVEKTIYHALDQKTDYYIEHRIVRKDGSERIVFEEGSIKMDAEENPFRVIGIVQDITEIKAAQDAVEKFSKVVEQIDDLVMISDLSGKINYVNAAFCEHTGYKREEVLGKTPRILKSDQYDDNFYKGLWSSILKGDVYKETIINKKKNGDLFYEKKTITPLRDDEENIIGFVSSGKDVTLETMMQKEIEYIASTDKLTGIHNRHKLEELFILEAERSRRFFLPLSLILIDIDSFKPINDTYGHNIGDEVLKHLVYVLQGNIRQLDIFARWGGEEFIILTPNTNYDNVQILAEKLRKSVENAHFPEVKNITISLGISTLKEADTFTELFQRADKRLYFAKDHGRNQVGII